ncbi:ABC transporter ATP-binding protein [Oceanicella actignis]|uniref:Branched-chain amino acid transport system ATP-binding protein n=1 Tax=Oceanicella actignis TaxID=1189325 RepID=A0A1M7TMQ0_9RHOB|nr:ABC transporter ATP-binding protein [Oceanicella actignis]TYO84651.1 branched-chain amino acid transport system ATP-binding protein [Oceanicella actignis]SET71584.1 amino acid/amide ABC transporter ATP-binding protein 2, HAAT family (TC 3.A.1.4.-) [Oceanicella actignis]SHN72012.1 branched-chain amino acid transport system ATP-binding protein [Oceanicella actignis]
MLQIRDLHAYYGKSHVLHGVNMDIARGEIVALLGRNGVGRSTTCKAVMGQVALEGSIRFKDQELAGRRSFEIARMGVGYVPENRDIFAGLTTRQNLNLGVKPGQKGGRWTMEDMFELFPNLRNRADVDAAVLSGGEQQMLTMCRTLMGDPEVIMIDEPTEGLSPQMTQRVADLLNEISRRGVSILLVEQKLAIALDIADRVYVMGHGQVVFEGTPDDLRARADVRKEWLEV